MSLYNHLQNSFARAQSLHAQATTGQPSGTPNFTFGGVGKQGVLNLTNVDMPGGPNGISRIENLEIVATRDQFAAKPIPAPRIAVTALGRAWWCTKCGESEFHYFLTCVPA